MRLFPNVLIILCACSLAACGGRKQGEQRTETMFELRDDLGRLVRFESYPSRIISLAPSVTESMYMLGADSRLVGVTKFCDFPPEASSKVIVGDLINPDLERILTLQPDLVLLSVEGNRRQTFDQLQRLNIPVFVTNPRSISGIIKSIRDLGVIAGRESPARAFEDSLRSFLSIHDPHRHVAAESRPRVLMVIDVAPLMAAGRESYIDGLIAATGGVNAVSEPGGAYPVLNREGLLGASPDIILLPDDLDTDLASLLARFPEWRETPAVRNGRVVRVDPDLFMRPGPRVLEGLDTLLQIIHPRVLVGVRR